MRTTTNLGLVVWDSASDPFDSAQLAANWDAIDADYSRSRPTDRAEILAAVPNTGNFNGRLVYLSAADSGFAAGTLIRYHGAVWKPVGPFEVFASVPTLSNYAGRLVLLSAASSGFAAWTLIRYDGSSWATANYTFEILATVPVSGNFAGRTVILTTADGGYNAYDMIRYSGSAWARIGPQPVPPGTELAYSAQATDATTTNAVSPGDTLLTFSAATFENVKYYFEINVPNLRHSVDNASITFRLEESTTLIGNAIQFDLYANGRGVSNFARIPFTPSAGAHTYNVKWYVSTAGTGTIKTTSLAPATFRIFKA